MVRGYLPEYKLKVLESQGISLPLQPGDLELLKAGTVDFVAVLHDENRLVIAVIKRVQSIAQTHRIDLPAPLAFLQIGIDDAPGQVGLGGLEPIAIIRC